MFLFYVLSFFKKGDTIQGGTLFKGGHDLRKYGTYKEEILPVCWAQWKVLSYYKNYLMYWMLSQIFTLLSFD